MPNITRQTDYPIDPLFLNRWSPRAFTGEAIDDATLFSFFEAARWAPSAFNSQPWRFIYAKNGSDQWPAFLDLLFEFNRSWADNASALILVLSRTTFTPPGKDQPIAMPSHAFDTGAAAALLMLQASLSGWATHGIGGFNKERARSQLNIPAHYMVESAIAIGRRADKSILPIGLQDKEIPSSRRPISEFVADGRFLFDD
ncbi:MAG: nitroreductase family protein [Methylobacter sp.]